MIKSRSKVKSIERQNEERINQVRPVMPKPNSDTFDVDIFMRLMGGEEAHIVATQRGLTSSSVMGRFHHALNFLQTTYQQRIPQGYYENPQKYTSFWMDIYHQYKTALYLNDPNNVERKFIMYFVTLSRVSKIKFLKDLEQLL